MRTAVPLRDVEGDDEIIGSVVCPTRSQTVVEPGRISLELPPLFNIAGSVQLGVSPGDQNIVVLRRSASDLKEGGKAEAERQDTCEELHLRFKVDLLGCILD